MKIQFNQEEQIEFLKLSGYTIDRYIGERFDDIFVDDVQRLNFPIAYFGEKPNDLDSMDTYHLRDKYEVESVFHRTINKRFKAFIFNELAYE